MFVRLCELMDRMTIVESDGQTPVRTWDLCHGEHIRVYPDSLGAVVFAVLRDENMAKLSFTDGRYSMKVDGEFIPVDVTRDYAPGLQSIGFRPTYVGFRSMELGLRAVMKLFPLLYRSEEVWLFERA